VLFLCQHGGAKSVIAAAYFNRLAADGGLPFVAEAAASEEPYAAVVAPVADLLAGEGFAVEGLQPRRASESDFEDAAKVIRIGCDLPADVRAAVDDEAWNDVPAASEDLAGSVRAIRRHVEALAEALRGRS
jgi:arsenate reductase